jgi:hypothetical protein
MTVKYHGNVDAIVAAISGIEKTAGKLKDDIHKTAVSIAKLWHDGKITPQDGAALLSKVQSASPYHAQAFSKWVQVFFPTLEFAKDNQVWFAKDGVEHKIMGKDFIALRDKPFWEVSPPKKADPFDDMAKLEAFLQMTVKHRKDVAEGKAPEGSKPMPMSLFDAIRKTITEYKAAQEEHAA